MGFSFEAAAIREEVRILHERSSLLRELAHASCVEARVLIKQSEDLIRSTTRDQPDIREWDWRGGRTSRPAYPH